jgi:hypothetical protein
MLLFILIYISFKRPVKHEQNFIQMEDKNSVIKEKYKIIITFLSNLYRIIRLKKYKNTQVCITIKENN